MARNEEKAQSMLFRFREAKAAEMGLSLRTDKRPKMASACTDLRQCERWRGEIMKEISRKVSKIQDMGLTDYEVRDLNDEINKLMREKFHWENQIIALGGANYKRAAPKMLTADGREVPGLRGYKYFGRAKDLPGVKELFEQTGGLPLHRQRWRWLRNNGSNLTAAEEMELQSFKNQKASIFSNRDSAYYGDLDEQDSELLEEERKIEEAEWKERYENVFDILGLPPDTPIPATPRAEYVTLTYGASTASEGITESTASLGDKRKEAPESANFGTAKKAKGTERSNGSGHRILTVLKAEDLQPLRASAKEIEQAILNRQKEELLKEYVG